MHNGEFSFVVWECNLEKTELNKLCLNSSDFSKFSIWINPWNLCEFTQNLLQVSVTPPKSYFLESLQISRVSLQGAQACLGRPDGAISWPPQSSVCMWLVLTRIPLSSNACLDLSQTAPGRPDQREYIYKALSCVGPAPTGIRRFLLFLHFLIQQWESNSERAGG